MPTYEYACKACGKHVEVAQSFTDAPLNECPRCQGELRKVFSPIGIAFKGSGFYKTDSRTTASSGAAKGESTEKSSSDTKADTKSSDTKSSDTKTADTKAADKKTADKKPADSKKSEAKSA